MDKIGICKNCKSDIYVTESGLTCNHECEGELSELLIEDNVPYKGKGVPMRPRPSNHDLEFNNSWYDAYVTCSYDGFAFEPVYRRPAIPEEKRKKK
ncbi:MAG: hypothetical protein ACXADW_02830 [Candidatus Hodarchaeales archaeon]